MLVNRLLSNSSFTPRNLAGLAGWWDFSLFSSITKDGSDKVSNVKDISGNGIDLAQATGGNQPTWNSAALNGRDGIQFAAASGNYLNTASNVLDTDEHDFIVVGESGLVSAVYDLLGTGGIAPGDALLMTNITGGFPKAHLWGSAETSVTSGTSTTTDAMIYEQYMDATDLYLRSNKVARGNTALVGTKSGVSVPIYAATRLASSFLDGWIYEIIVYNRALATSERTLIENYLNAKWGV